MISDKKDEFESADTPLGAERSDSDINETREKILDLEKLPKNY